MGSRPRLRRRRTGGVQHRPGGRTRQRPGGSERDGHDLEGRARGAFRSWAWACQELITAVMHDGAGHAELRARLRRARALRVAAGAHIILIDVTVAVVVDSVADLDAGGARVRCPLGQWGLVRAGQSAEVWRFPPATKQAKGDAAPDGPAVGSQ